jgi:RNA polymerase sigma factor (sigma-70 family)
VSEEGAKTNMVLLGWAQEYLRLQLEMVKPESLVVAAWDEFYRIYDTLLRRIAHSRGLRGSDVDDCAQNVWLEVVRRLPEFERPEGQSGLRSWLYSVVRSKTNDFLRHRLRHPAESLDIARKAGHEPAGPECDPAEAAVHQWEQSLLEILIEDLSSEIPETNARLLRMRCLEGRDTAEVAAELGLSSEQVWYRLHRLIKKLQVRVAVFTGEALGGNEAETVACEGASA